MLLSPVGPLPLASQPAAVPLSGAARWADSARVDIERAVMSDDAAALTATGAMIDKALTAFPNDPLLLHYRGYALYREAMRTADDAGVSDAQEALLLRAIDLLRRSSASLPLAETHALLSSCLGTLAGTGMIAGMRYGPAASEEGERARALGPRNPRVLLLAGISAWFTPSMWGGGKDKGRGLVQQAVASFGGEAAPRPLPAWGAAEAYAWLGQMEQERGNHSAARDAYDRALALEPQFRWVRDVLRPAVVRR